MARTIRSEPLPGFAALGGSSRRYVDQSTGETFSRRAYQEMVAREHGLPNWQTYQSVVRDINRAPGLYQGFAVRVGEKLGMSTRDVSRPGGPLLARYINAMYDKTGQRVKHAGTERPREWQSLWAYASPDTGGGGGGGGGSNEAGDQYEDNDVMAYDDPNDDYYYDDEGYY